MKIKSVIVIVVAVLSVSTILARPNYDRVEVTINASIDVIKPALLVEFMDAGYNIDKDSDFTMEMSRRCRGTEDFMVAMGMGNAYSTNMKICTFVFIKTPAGIRVILTTFYQTQMPGGQIHKETAGTKKTFGLYTKSFQKIKLQLESK